MSAILQHMKREEWEKRIAARSADASVKDEAEKDAEDEALASAIDEALGVSNDEEN